MSTTLCLGYCATNIFQNIEQRVNEKLSPAEQRQVSFVEGAPLDFYNTIERLYANRNDEVGVVDQRLNVVFVLDASADQSVATFGDTIRECAKSAERYGVHGQIFHLIWLVNESTNNTMDYPAKLNVFPHGDGGFSRIYILSNKRNNMAIGKDDYANGAAMIICLMSMKMNAIESGVYVVGTGKQTVSTHEINEYTRHRVAEMIKSGQFPHPDFKDMESLCFKCFQEDIGDKTGLQNHLRNLFDQNVCEKFWYIIGDEERQVEINEKIDLQLIQDLLLQWKENILARIRRTPFIEDAIAFFGKADSFERFVNDFEMEFSRNTVEKQTRRIRWMFGRKKRIAMAYEQYLSNRENLLEKFIREFCRIWVETAESFPSDLKAYATKRDSLLLPYMQENAFIDQCKYSAQQSTIDIDMHLQRLSFTENNCGDFIDDDNEKAQNAISQWMDYCVAEIRPHAEMPQLLEEIARTEAYKFWESVLKPIDDRKTVFAYSVQDPLNEIRFKCFFMPSTRFRIDDLRQYLNGYPETDILPVSNDHYNNIEEILLLKLTAQDLNINRETMDKALRKLTAFNHPPIMSSNNFVQSPAKMPAETKIDAEKEEICEENQDADQPENEWRLSVDLKNRKLLLDWPDKGPGQVNCAIYPENMRTHGRLIDRVKYGINGGIPIPEESLGYGIYTAEITSHGKTVSKINFVAKRHMVRLVVSPKELSLNKEELETLKITLESVDDDPNQSLDRDTYDCLQLRLTEKSVIPLSMPKFRKKRCTWTVYMHPIHFAYSMYFAGSGADCYQLYYSEDA